MHRLAPLLLVTALVGCPQDQGIQRLSGQDTFYQEPPADVDILWVVDNSPSMQQEQEEVGRRFAEFIGHLEDTNIDFHIGVITTDMDDDTDGRAVLLGDPPVLSSNVPDYDLEFNERVQVGIDGSDQERGLEAAYQALTEPMISDANDGFLRRDAVLSIIFVSDENDCSDQGGLPASAGGMACYDQADKLVPVRDYIDDFRTMKDDPSDIMASAIVGPDISENCEDTVPGIRYLSVAQNLGGVSGNICDNDFTDIMDQMGLSVSGVRSSFQLSKTPVEETLEIYVGEDEDDESGWSLVPKDDHNGWSYDESTLYITFNGDSVPPRGSVITVMYEIAGSAG